MVCFATAFIHIKNLLAAIFICLYNQNIAGCCLIGFPIFISILGKVVSVFICIYISLIFFSGFFIRIDNRIIQHDISRYIAKIYPISIRNINFANIAVLFYSVIYFIASDLPGFSDIQYCRRNICLYMTVKIQFVCINRIIINYFIYFFQQLRCSFRFFLPTIRRPQCKKSAQ